MDLSWEAKPRSLFIVSLLFLSLFPFLILPGNNEATASQHRLSIVSETGGVQHCRLYFRGTISVLRCAVEGAFVFVWKNTGHRLPDSK